MAETSIEWTWRPGTKGETWNPTTGCDKVSPGCGLPRFDGDKTGGCYAMAMAKRLKAMGQAKYQTDGDPRTSGPGFGIAVHPDTLDQPLHWRMPRTVFVNSMSDLGHARVPREFLAKVWATMARTPQHTYQILSKRPERMARIVGSSDFYRAVLTETGQADPGAVSWSAEVTGEVSLHWPLPNVWLGTSIETDDYTGRADDLRATPAAVRFISAEPLLGPLPSLDLTGIHWLIIGGESGPNARPMDLRWAYDLVDRARQSGTAVFVKQVGTVQAGGRGKGGEWDLLPAGLQRREYPRTAEAVIHG
jgi:protein gp37